MSDEKFRKLLGRQIRLHRQLQGHTHAKLAEMTKLHDNSISRIENGMNTISSYKLYKIYCALGININSIFDSIKSELDSDIDEDTN